MSHFRRAALLTIFSACLLTACAGPGGPGPRGGGPGGAQPPGARGALAELDGAYIAQPIALVLAGYDADHDGSLTRAELSVGGASEWVRMDRNADSTVSLIELSAWADTYLGSATARPSQLSFDRDGSGSISSREVMTQLEAEFATADKNGDGVVTRGELVRQLSLPSQQMGGRGGPGGGRPRGGGGPGGGQAPR